jgi:hypothetical protein
MNNAEAMGHVLVATALGALCLWGLPGILAAVALFIAWVMFTKT